MFLDLLISWGSHIITIYINLVVTFQTKMVMSGKQLHQKCIKVTNILLSQKWTYTRMVLFCRDISSSTVATWCQIYNERSKILLFLFNFIAAVITLGSDGNVDVNKLMDLSNSSLDDAENTDFSIACAFWWRCGPSSCSRFSSRW